MAALQANFSLLVIEETGIGKSVLEEAAAEEPAFLICDDTHCYAVQLHTWLAQLHEQGQSL